MTKPGSDERLRTAIEAMRIHHCRRIASQEMLGLHSAGACTICDVVREAALADSPRRDPMNDPWENNPPGCTCEFVHRSDPTCPSKAPSQGAIKDVPESAAPAPSSVVTDAQSGEFVSSVMDSAKAPTIADRVDAAQNSASIVSIPESAAPAPSSPHDHKHTCAVVDNFSPLEGYCTCDPEHPVPWPTIVDESKSSHETAEERSMGGARLEALIQQAFKDWFDAVRRGECDGLDKRNAMEPWIARRVAALAPTEETPLVGPRDSLDSAGDYLNVERIVHKGFQQWAEKPHNKKWVKRLEGTPIANDLLVNITAAMSDWLAARREPGPRAKEQAREWLQVHFPPGNLGFWNWQTVDSLAALAGPGDRAMAGARLEEARWWWRLASECECQKDANNGEAGCTCCKRIAELERAAAIERSQTPQSREAVVDSPREARNEK
jgi:hypothetical protein